MEMRQVQCVPRYGVAAAEVTWQNGLPRGLPATTTLQSPHHQFHSPIKSSLFNNQQAPPWFDDHPNYVVVAPGLGDGVVPVQDHQEAAGRESSTHVGSCSGATVPVVEESVSIGTLLCRTTSSSSLELESRSASWEDADVGSYNSSPSCGEDKTTTTYKTVVWTQQMDHQHHDNSSSYKPLQDHHSFSSQPSTPHPRALPQKENFDEKILTRKKMGKFSVSTKRSRATAVHSQSERRRREKINQRIKILQRMVPNSTKADQASTLDEVIEYMKQLQAQVQMTRICMSQMMVLQQYINMSMMGMGVMDLNAIGRAMGMPPPIPVPSGMSPMFPLATFQPMVPWNGQGDRLSSHDFLSAFLSNQQQHQPAGYDAYNKLTTFYQQFQQPFDPEK